MKLFLSYGHETANAPLVARIVAALAPEHDVWRDTCAIKAGDDWRRRIVDGVLGSHWTLGVLSRHSTRAPGVCRDELAIALHHNGGAIATILVEAESEVTPPVSLSHIQWLDMHDWRARQEADPAAFEAWFADKVATLRALLASPATQRFSGEIEDLRRLLRPVPQHDRIGKLVEGFVGRVWLRDRLDAWRRGEAPSRLFWVTGAPGTGKSAFAAWLAHHNRSNVIGLNLCAYNSDDLRLVTPVLCTLAFQIATRVADYRTKLLEQFHSEDPGGARLRDRTPFDLFGWLLTAPLKLCVDGGRSQDRLVVVIDALDETIRDGRSPLAEVLAERAPDLPGWIAMVVTGRPDKPLPSLFAGQATEWIDAEAGENAADLRVYAQGWLGPAGPVERVVAAADGNFQYLRLLHDGVRQGQLSLDDPAGLPQGLVGLYLRWFQRQFPDPASYDAEIRPLLSVLTAALLPVPEAVPTSIFGWSTPVKARVLARLGSLFARRAEGVAPFHKSLRDWLLDDCGSDSFLVDVSWGADRLRTALWQELAAGNAALSGFARAELPRLLEAYPDARLAAELVVVGDSDALLDRAGSAAEASKALYAWASARSWWRLLIRMAGLLPEPALAHRAYAWGRLSDVEMKIGTTAAVLISLQRCLADYQQLADAYPGNALLQRELSVSHNKIGDVLVAQGDLPGARDAYRASMAIADRRAATDPGNAEWQRDLSISHTKIGDVLVAQGDLPGALAAYRAGMTIAERLAAAAPDHAGWKRDLLVSRIKIGDVLRAQGDLPGALAAYRAAMAIAERLAADPGNALWQRDLSVSHNRIGDVLRAQGDLPGALAAYRAGMAIAGRLATADPGSAEWQRDLSVSHNKIGDVLVAQGDLPGALAAYRAGMAIHERLAAADPGNAEWQRDLSISHDRIGDVLVAQGDLPGAVATYRVGMAIRERLAAADPGNALWQRDLSLSYERIGDMLRAQGDLPGALAAYRASMEIRERLAAADPGNALWQRDLSISYERIGDVLRAQGDLPGALAAYRASMEIRERLAAADPGNAEWQRDLSVSHERIGDVLVAQGDLPGALAAYRARMAIAERLAAVDPSNAEWQRDLFVSLFHITRLLLGERDRAAACAAAGRLDGQARLLAERFPHDIQRNDYLRAAKDLLAQACGPAAAD